MENDPSTTAGDVLRELAPRVLGALTRRCGNFATAEDALAEALLAAVVAWKDDGLPGNPAGWVFEVAIRKLADLRRNDSARDRREQSAAIDADAITSADFERADFVEDPGDVLRSIFLCCHPAIAVEQAIALTLRAIGGLTTAEIAHAFLVPETTLAQRISRAKEKLRSEGATFELPVGAERRERLGIVGHVLYLLYNEGHTASSGERLQRPVLASEAIRLARLLHRLVPDDRETAGLLALLLLTDSRRDTRTNEDGALIPLDQQDRSRWDRAQIAEGLAILDAILPHTAFHQDAGRFQIEAAISALHASAPSFDATDWRGVLRLYDQWLRLHDHPLVALQRPIAIAMIEGPAAGLAELAKLESNTHLAGTFRFETVRAHLLERAGQIPAAIASFRAAAAMAKNAAERAFLERKIAQLERS